LAGSASRGAEFKTDAAARDDTADAIAKSDLPEAVLAGTNG
jgi:hypothetical protein